MPVLLLLLLLLHTARAANTTTNSFTYSALGADVSAPRFVESNTTWQFDVSVSAAAGDLVFPLLPVPPAACAGGLVPLCCLYGLADGNRELGAYLHYLGPCEAHAGASSAAVLEDAPRPDALVKAWREVREKKAKGIQFVEIDPKKSKSTADAAGNGAVRPKLNGSSSNTQRHLGNERAARIDAHLTTDETMPRGRRVGGDQRCIRGGAVGDLRRPSRRKRGLDGFRAPGLRGQRRRAAEREAETSGTGRHGCQREHAFKKVGRRTLHRQRAVGGRIKQLLRPDRKSVV